VLYCRGQDVRSKPPFKSFQGGIFVFHRLFVFEIFFRVSLHDKIPAPDKRAMNHGRHILRQTNHWIGHGIFFGELRFRGL
jgi:hypothetical protein